MLPGENGYYDRNFLINDKNRFEKVQPPRMKNTTRSLRTFDWLKRDFEMARLVEKTIGELKQNLGKPVRVSVARVGRLTNSVALLNKHIDRLPSTKKIIVENVESISEFQMRRIDWAINFLILKGMSPKEWLIKKTAGIGRSASPKVNDYIVARIGSINYKEINKAA